MTNDIIMDIQPNKPSKPSIQFIALVTPTIQKTVIAIDKTVGRLII